MHWLFKCLQYVLYEYLDISLFITNLILVSTVKKEISKPLSIYSKQKRDRFLTRLFFVLNRNHSYSFHTVTPDGGNTFSPINILAPEGMFKFCALEV
jgi:hypothetical protein